MDGVVFKLIMRLNNYIRMKSSKYNFKIVKLRNNLPWYKPLYKRSKSCYDNKVTQNMNCLLTL